jgi:hypothetical protein
MSLEAWRKHRADLQKLGQLKVQVGWFESNRYPNGEEAKPETKAEAKERKTTGRGNQGIPVAQVAYWNEYGTVTSPARPFMRLADYLVQRSMLEVKDKLIQKMSRGQLTPEQVMGQFGLFVEAAIVDSIKNGGWAANSPVTVNGSANGFIKGKGFNAPLIDTGLMWKSVVSKVLLAK